MSLITPKTALISLSNKSHLDELIKFLLDQEVKIISTGGTYNAIKKITDQVIEVSEFTGFEEMMDGRVKTLHPKIHAGILARRELDLEVLTDDCYCLNSTSNIFQYFNDIWKIKILRLLLYCFWFPRNGIRVKRNLFFSN